MLATVGLAILFLSYLVLLLYRAGCYRFGWRGYSSAPSSFRYPSTLWSLILGTICCWQLVEFADDSVLWWLFLAVATAHALAAILAWVFASSKAPESEATHRAESKESLLDRSAVDTQTRLVQNPGILDIWLESDAPVDDEQDDMLDVGHLVSQIAQSLLENPGSTIGLLGALGSGKTSILNMAIGEVKEETGRGTHIFASVPSWGIRADSLSAHALSCGVDELSKFIDTLAVSAVPENYVTAVREAGPNWARMLSICVARGPLEQLLRLNEAMLATGGHIVFLIEDLDRNADDSRMADLYVELQGLLDRLRQCERLSFILSVGHTSLDFDRLCDFKVSVPKLNETQTGAVLQAFRHHSLARALDSGAVLPDYSQKEVEHIATSSPSAALRLWAPRRVVYDHSLPWKHILPLIGNPRRLKSVLRATRDAWSRLTGEVNFDQLFVVQCLRAVSPSAIDSIADIKEFMDTESFTGDDKEKKRIKSWVQSRIARVLDRIPVADQEHVEALIGFLVPSSVDSVIDFLVDSDRSPVVQDAKVSDVYWQRLWSGQDVGRGEGDPRDQAVLNSIADARRSEDWHEFAKRLETEPNWGAVYERLHSKHHSRTPECLMAAKEHLSASAALYDVLVREQGPEACEDNSAAFIPLWRTTLNSNRVSTDILLDWIRAQIAKVLPQNLCLATDIIYYWAAGSETQLTPKQSTTVITEVAVLAQELWNDCPERLCNGLGVASLSHAHALGRCFSLGHERQSVPDIESTWGWIAPVLEKALEIEPFKVAYAITGFSVGSQHSVAPDEDENWGVRADMRPRIPSILFPAPAQRLGLYRKVARILDEERPASMHPLVDSWLDRAVDSISKWLGEGAPEVGDSVE